MAAPSFSGLTDFSGIIRVGGNTNTPRYAGSIAAEVFGGSAEITSFGATTSPVANTVYACGKTVSSTDISNDLLVLGINVDGLNKLTDVTDSTTLAGISIAIRDSGGTNARRWNLSGTQTENIVGLSNAYGGARPDVPVIIDPTQTSTAVNTSSINLASVNRVEFYGKLKSNTSFFIRLSRVYRIPKSTGITISDGDISSPATAGSFVTWVRSLEASTVELFTEAAIDNIVFNIPITIAATYWNSVGETLTWWPTADFNSADKDIRNHISNFRLNINPPANATILFNGTQIKAYRSKLLFSSTPGANSVIQFTNCYLSNIATATFNSNYSFFTTTLDGFDQVTINGAN